MVSLSICPSRGGPSDNDHHIQTTTTTTTTTKRIKQCGTQGLIEMKKRDTMIPGQQQDNALSLYLYRVSRHRRWSSPFRGPGRRFACTRVDIGKSLFTPVTLKGKKKQ